MALNEVLGTPISTKNLDLKDRRKIAEQIRKEVIQLKQTWDQKHL